ncbi:rab3 GTPase-activating protein non-catalytic subunit-like isoform X2 [Branchiostoma floridae x Branchiostoma belcheri]
MSCTLSIEANIQNVSTVRKFLFPNLLEEPVTKSPADDGWEEEDWGWGEEFTEETQQQKKKKEEEANSWLEDCCISLSPTNDLLALAFEDRAVFLSHKWDSDKLKYQMSWKGPVNLEEGECVTSIMCIPLASLKRSSTGGPDWTCVVMGFTSGYIRMYTENGNLLLSQLLHEDPVLKVKCSTYQPRRHAGAAEQLEELTILYPNALVTIDGFSLYQSLRACRNQVARAAAGGSDVQPPPLAYKKWGLGDQANMVDHISCGVVTPSLFDQLQTASILGGYGATITQNPPPAARYITSGTSPYVAFFFAVEGTAPPIISEVAAAVASKLKSALISGVGGWLGWKGKPQGEDPKQKPKVEPATPLPLRFGLPDLRRHGDSIVLSPGRQLAATTDSFGRVILIDTDKGVAIRVWKGYRDAQVGWVKVTEDKDRDAMATDTPPREALFLIIYAPRRGILEVWAMQQGPRVAAFNVGKQCRLLCPGYTMMGLNNVTFYTNKPPTYQCCLVEPSGVIKIINVPFHLILSGANSKRARDLHLLKKLSTILSTPSSQEGSLEKQLVNIISDIKIVALKRQGLEKILAHKILPADLMRNVIRTVKNNIQLALEKEDPDSIAPESRGLLHFCKVQELLLDVYITISLLNKQATQAMGMAENNPEQTLAATLSVSVSEALQYLSAVDDFMRESAGNRVHFQDPIHMTPAAFLSCFICPYHHADDNAPTASSLKILMSSDIDEQLSLKLGTFLFKCGLTGGDSIEALCSCLERSGIPAADLMSLLLRVWLNSETELIRPRDVSPFSNLHCLLASITRTAEPNTVSPWWQSVRDICTAAEAPASALMAAVAARSVAASVVPNNKSGNKEQDSQEDKDTDQEALSLSSPTPSTTSTDTMEEWETVAMDTEHWNLLVRQLEDVVVLSTLLRSKVRDGVDRPPSYAETMGKENKVVSVKGLLEGGSGSIAALVANWVARTGILPSMLSVSHHAEGEDEEAMELGTDVTSEPALPELERLADLYRSQLERFPYSLDPEVLHAHCTWEYVVQWNKDPEVVALLERSIEHLKFVGNAYLQHGLGCMMWHTFMVKRFSATAFLMEKVGKAPKDRLCRKDVGLSDAALTNFLGQCNILLQVILEAEVESPYPFFSSQAEVESSHVPVFDIEDLWQATQGPTSIAELAAEQRVSNYQLLQHHMKLSSIMHAVMVFSLRTVKPLSYYFDTKGKNAFFKDLHSYPLLPGSDIDIAIISARQQFLCRIVSAAVGTLPIPPAFLTKDDGAVAMETDKEKELLQSDLDAYQTMSDNKVVLEACKWADTILELGQRLEVDVDVVRRHYCNELYSRGYDYLGQEVLNSVNERCQLGCDLLLLVGKRLSHLMSSAEPKRSVQLLSRLPPTLSTWLKQQSPSDVHFPDVPLLLTAQLLSQVVSLLPETHGQYSLAIQLVESIDIMRD